MGSARESQPPCTARYKPESPSAAKGRPIAVLLADNAQRCISIDDAVKLYVSLSVAIQQAQAARQAERQRRKGEQQQEATGEVPFVEIP